eukprot:2016233-Rhodomonas_salina.1
MRLIVPSPLDSGGKLIVSRVYIHSVGAETLTSEDFEPSGQRPCRVASFLHSCVRKSLPFATLASMCVVFGHVHRVTTALCCATVQWELGQQRFGYCCEIPPHETSFPIETLGFGISACINISTYAPNKTVCFGTAIGVLRRWDLAWYIMAKRSGFVEIPSDKVSSLIETLGFGTLSCIAFEVDEERAGVWKCPDQAGEWFKSTALW